MNKPIESIRKGIRILAVIAGILIIFPAVQAEELLKPDVIWVSADPYNYQVSDRPNTYDIRYIVIHDIEGYYRYTIDELFAKPNPAHASTQYVISKTGEITQMVDDKDIAWHAGNNEYSKRSIGIEHEGFADTCQYTEEEYIASAKLVKWLAQEYNIPLVHLQGIAPADSTESEGVIGHYQVPNPNDPTRGGGISGHYDPGICWDWDHYMELLTEQPKSNLDLIFLIDTTGSMGDDIASVKASAGEIVNALDSTGFDYRVAVADYRDYPKSPYGGEMDYVYNLKLPFSSDKSAIINSINGLNLGWGADWRESVYSALVMSMLDVNKSIANSDNHGWRSGVHKAIIIMGDAPPHDPELWKGGYTLEDVIYWSENIDPIRVYSIVVGYDSSTYAAFSKISEKTGGKVYLSPDAADVADAIIKAIRDIGTDGYGVDVNITPVQSETNPGSSVIYSVNITNKGDVADVYNVSFEAENILGSYRGHPLAIQYSWIMFDDSKMELDPSMSEIRPLEINVPQNWAGMEEIIYSFNVTATSTTNASIGNTSSAELKVKASKRSMAEYSKLEIQWLSELVNGSDIDHGIKNALLAKLTNAESKVDQAIVSADNNKQFGNNLKTAQNVMNAFINQVNAQYDKKIMQPDAEMLKEKANQILQDLETAKNS